MEKILGYDCDGEEILEYRILRFPFSTTIDDWEEVPNVDPRFYCAIESSNNEYWAISVYDDYNSKYIKKYENLDPNSKVPTIIKPISEMEGYEVAFDGITGNEWFYDRDIKKLKKELENLLKNKNSQNIKQLIKQ